MPGKKLIGIVSDTHDNRESIVGAVRLFNRRGCSLVVHAGDFVAPFTAREFAKLDCPFIGVFGNNDGERKGLLARYSTFGELHEGPHEFTFGGRKFALMHEPAHLDDYLARGGVDVIVYG
ncbi:MAG: YfcE family phosphodiesterase, partial [Candidatus Latescibacteria bacterium]|nr:YfcE family phosphodiesterase [Candidatus Latescibacterota bacterium]